MAVRARLASLETDREHLIEFFARWLTPLSTRQRFDWLYRGNPEGDARAWVLCTDRGMIGACAAFPRRLLVGGETVRGYVLGDFCIQPEYRTLGPALELQRACLAGMTAECAPWFDFPSTSMVAVYARLGIGLGEPITRFAKLLRADRKITHFVKSPTVAKGLSAVTNPWLALRDWGRASNNGYAIDFHRRACGEEFTKLAETVSVRYGLCSWRSSDYLNWRYRAHPLQNHRILTARRDGRLSAYAVFTRSNQDANLVDWFGTEDLALSELVLSLADHLRDKGVATLSAALQPSHPRATLLRDLGFQPRETCPAVTVTPATLAGRASMQSSRWFLSYGDRDS